MFAGHSKIDGENGAVDFREIEVFCDALINGDVRAEFFEF